MSKYIVKNCPNLSESYYADGHISQNECSLEIDDRQCVDCTDCLIKQVIEKCRKKKEWFSKLSDGVAFDLKTFTGGNLQDEILQLFKIEECNDEV